MTPMHREAAPCRGRVLAWARDPAVCAWSAVGLLALFPLRAVLT